MGWSWWSFWCGVSAGWFIGVSGFVLLAVASARDAADKIDHAADCSYVSARAALASSRDGNGSIADAGATTVCTCPEWVTRCYPDCPTQISPASDEQAAVERVIDCAANLLAFPSRVSLRRDLNKALVELNALRTRRASGEGQR